MSWFAETFPDRIDALQALYAQNHRAYHTWDHIQALLGHYRRLQSAWSDPKAVEVAVYYHDAIYQPLSINNEADSVKLMTEHLSGHVAETILDHANALILATAEHKVPDGVTPELAMDCALFLDIDLSILGAPEAEFDRYDEAIRTEFAAIPDDVFLPRRRAIMAAFLDRPRLFLTDSFHASHDATARANLRRLVDRLST